MNSEKGFIGFFDILGYTSILENNDPKMIAEPVLKLLTSLDSNINDEILSLTTKFEASGFHDILKNEVKWLVFSDTILVSMAIPEKTDDGKKELRWIAFIAVCKLLQMFMLKKGLPVRGAINHGEYLIQGTCFAGRPIVEAYKMSQNLDLSACVFTEKASTCINEIWKLTEKNNIIAEYLVPLKDGTEAKLPTLNYIPKDLTEDPRELVLKAFWAFNKDIPTSVQQKVLNTEQHIRFLLHRNRDADKKLENSSK